MALVPYQRRNRGELGRLRSDMEDLFNSFLGNWELPLAERKFWPAVDVADKDDRVIVKAEIPGCKADDIDISVQGNTLSIIGEKKHESETSEEGFYHVESTYGAFRRDVSVPTEVDATRVDASYRDGILTVTLPKAEKAKATKVKIKG